VFLKNEKRNRMKIKITLFLALIFVSSSYSQVDLSVGMGINYASAPSLKDYINANYAGDLATFSSSVEFNGEVLYTISPSFQLGIEYAMSIFSYSTRAGFNYDLNYNLHKPSLLAFYVLAGEGYKFKFGGGAGPRLASVKEEIHSAIDYSAIGFGLLLRGEGHTGLGGNFYAMIAVDMRYDLPGRPKDGDAYLGGNTTQEVDVNTLSFGVKLGISYFL